MPCILLVAVLHPTSRTPEPCTLRSSFPGLSVLKTPVPVFDACAPPRSRRWVGERMLHGHHGLGSGPSGQRHDRYYPSCWLLLLPLHLACCCDCPSYLCISKVVGVKNTSCVFAGFGVGERIVSSTTRTLHSFTANYRFMSAYRFQQGTASRLYLFRLRLITHHCSVAAQPTVTHIHPQPTSRHSDYSVSKQALASLHRQILSKLLPLHSAY